jgi:serine/threonine protein kinase
VAPAAEHPAPTVLERLAHEYGLKEELEGDWAVRPLELVRERGGMLLVLEDPGGEPLERVVGVPMEMGTFLRLAIGIAGVLGKLHQRSLVHKDIKPAHILVNHETGEIRLTGFGLASRLPRPRAASSVTCGAASPHGRRSAGSTTSRSAKTTPPTASSFPRSSTGAHARS